MTNGIENRTKLLNEKYMRDFCSRHEDFFHEIQFPSFDSWLEPWPNLLYLLKEYTNIDMWKWITPQPAQPHHATNLGLLNLWWRALSNSLAAARKRKISSEAYSKFLTNSGNIWYWTLCPFFLLDLLSHVTRSSSRSVKEGHVVAHSTSYPDQFKMGTVELQLVLHKYISISVTQISRSSACAGLWALYSEK